MTDLPTQRIFLGIPIEPSLKEEIARQYSKVPGNQTTHENHHITLHFLGNTPASQMENLCKKFHATVLGTEFEAELNGLGAFPRVEQARIIWLGVGDGASELSQIYDKAGKILTQLGHPVETRKYFPHLTLSRMKKIQDVRRWISKVPHWEKTFLVNRVVLFESFLTSKGSHYVERESFPLKERPRDSIA